MRHPKLGVTLVELMAAIAIMAVLMGIFFPAVQVIRESARRVNCQNNLRQIASAALNFESSRNVFPPGQIAPVAQPCDFTQHSLVGHLGYLLPFLEQKEYIESLGDLNWNLEASSGPWFSNPTTLASSDAAIPGLRCPSDRSEEVRVLMLSSVSVDGLTHLVVLDVMSGALPQGYQGWTNYSGCTGQISHNGPLNGVFFSRSRIRVRDITDGTSTTIMLGESIGGATSPNDESNLLGTATARSSILSNGIGLNWGFFEEIPYDNQATSIHVFSSRHAGKVANFAMADGSIRGITALVDRSLLGALMTRSGAEVVVE